MTAARKAVVLARGLGKRMRREDGTALDRAQSSVAETGVKAMIPIGRPFLDYVLSALADAGYEEACLVIGPEHGAVRDYYTGQSPPRRIRIAFAIQERPQGTADAVASAEPFAAGENFLVINSDNYYPVGVLRELRLLSEPATALFRRGALLAESNIEPERIASYAVCTVGPDGYLTGILEKPDEAALTAAGADPLISMNCWRFSPSIFGPCRSTPLSPRGERELPRAVHDAITHQGLRLRVIRAPGGVLDLSRRADVASVAARLRGVEASP
ncbi:MAG TPA: nucleotidyltransferase family protein [Thermoanaerobaculia bacterium]|nr:nucleotidyltransferase family protein [Thermoanaerobaculia bacterium]